MFYLYKVTFRDCACPPENKHTCFQALPKLKSNLLVKTPNSRPQRRPNATWTPSGVGVIGFWAKQVSWMWKSDRLVHCTWSRVSSWTTDIDDALVHLSIAPTQLLNSAVTEPPTSSAPRNSISTTVVTALKAQHCLTSQIEGWVSLCNEKWGLGLEQ